MHNLPNNYQLGLWITFLAGMATVLGGCLTFFIKKDNLKSLSFGLGLSAGVMIFIGLTEVLKDSGELLSKYFPNHFAWLVFAGFFVGVFIAFILDWLMPDKIDNDLFVERDKCIPDSHRIKRAGLLVAIGISLHNFPEGLSMFFMTTQSITLGVSVALAVAIHNIPAGIAIALPIYHATGKKRLAILYSFLSGISELVGALIGLFLLQTVLPQMAVGFIFATVAGILIYISFDTLIPLSREYGDGHYSLFGIISGMFIIWLSLLMMGE
jgi:zinc transporter, ZIP family